MLLGISVDPNCPVTDPTAVEVSEQTTVVPPASVPASAPEELPPEPELEPEPDPELLEPELDPAPDPDPDPVLDSGDAPSETSAGPVEPVEPTGPHARHTTRTTLAGHLGEDAAVRMQRSAAAPTDAAHLSEHPHRSPGNSECVRGGCVLRDGHRLGPHTHSPRCSPGSRVPFCAAAICLVESEPGYQTRRRHVLGVKIPEKGEDDAEDDGERTAIGSRADLLRAAGRQRPYFIVLAGESAGEMLPIEASGAVIGRAADAGMRLRDDGISRRHARVTVEGGRVTVEDLGSANGTLVNGEPVARAVLRDGDKIQVGVTTILKFTYADELEESLRRRMHDAALYDALTKACNKQHFLERLDAEVSYAKRHRASLALLMLDIDHFKRINDTFGHPAGDRVLATLGQIVKGTVRTEDLFARYGGEEFAVLCRGSDSDGALSLAERLRERVQAAAVDYAGRPIAVTVSIGVATWFDQPDSSKKLIEEADQALYAAKRAGRNRVVRRPSKPG